MWKKNMGRLALAMVFSTAVAVTVPAQEEHTFVQGTTVNGLAVSGMTVEEAEEHIKGFYAGQYELTIKERNDVIEKIKGADIGFSVGVPAGFLQGVLDQQNAGGRAFGPDVNSKFRVEMANSYDEQALSDKFNGLKCISGSGIVATEDARISEYEEGKPFEIIKEVIGNNVDRDKTEEVIRNAVASGATEVDLQEAGCYYMPNVTSDSASLRDLCDTMNRCREMAITYVFGEEREVLDAAVICSWLTGTQDGEIQVDPGLALAYVQALAAKYDTVGTERTFHTADGRDVQVVGGSYGWKIDQAGELAALIAMIRTGQTQDREPAYVAAAVSRTAPEWGVTYAEVDLTNQHVYMTINGQVVWDADCVTGNVSRGNGTPAGVYSLTYKQRDRVLRGPLRSDGTYEYESPVSYWMPFNGGIGLHDANWRGSFGGSIYKNSGSHGCVNLPPSRTPALYELVYKGMPVICYN